MHYIGDIHYPAQFYEFANPVPMGNLLAIGVMPEVRDNHKSKELSPFIKAMTKDIPKPELKNKLTLRSKLADLVWPDFNWEAQVRTFNYSMDQAKLRGSQVPTHREMATVFRFLLPKYPKSDIPPDFADEFWGRLGGMSRAEFNSILADINRSGASGYPVEFYYKTKGDLLDSDPVTLYEAVQDRIRAINKHEVSEIKELTPLQRLQKNLCDPVKVFIKAEGHKRAKAELRPRPICNVSVIDEIITRWATRNQNDAEKLRCYSCPSAPGVGFSSDEQVKAFIEGLTKAGFFQYVNKGFCKDNDASGFDMSYREFLWDVDLYRRIRLAEGSPSAKSNYIAFMTRLKELSGHRVFILSNGLAVTGPSWIMLSGDYRTSSTNSFSRNFLAGLVEHVKMGLPDLFKVKSNGDDNLGSTTLSDDLYLEGHLEYGFLITDLTTIRDTFNFCSHLFNRKTLKAYPTNPQKAIFNLLHSKNENGEYWEFVWNNRHHPELEEMKEAIASSGWYEANVTKKTKQQEQNQSQAQAETGWQEESTNPFDKY
jgi:hypothetical protein